MNTSIHHSETIFNSLKKINITSKLSSIAIKHIITIIITIFSLTDSYEYYLQRIRKEWKTCICHNR